MIALHQKAKACLLIFVVLALYSDLVQGQATYPSAPVNQSYIPPSPVAQSFQQYGDNPVSLSTGTPAVSVPIYQVSCGSLTLPIGLSYNYSGFSPLQDAGWVGLGWNLNVGGVISRIVEGQVDSTLPAGYNYDQYNIYDSTIGTGSNPNEFLPKKYDWAPDLFDVEFSGGSGKFIWYQHKAYLLDYDKQLGISWPSINSNITVTTTDGTVYTFGAVEVTTSNNYWWGILGSSTTYNSAWYLTMIVSADKKDTINLNYATYTWQQPAVKYQNSYTLSTTSGVADMGYDTVSYYVQPSIQTQILQSVTCRNTRVSFIGNTLRPDVLGNYPYLQEIDVVDSLTGATVKKDLFSYEYFGQTTSNPQGYERLKLKRLNAVNTQNASDSLTYRFSYINEYGTNFPVKNTLALDDWGFYNGSTANTSLLPASSSPYYGSAPPSNFGGSNSRAANFTYSSYGALDTIVYPTGGYTVYQYQPNYYNSSGTATAGPGICLSTVTNYDNNQAGFATQKTYTYDLDGGTTCSGVVVNMPSYTAPPFQYSIVDGSNTTYNNYNVYSASNNAGGIGGISPKFYYSEVTETATSGGETHKSNYYFTSFGTLFEDVRLSKKIDYVNQLNTSNFSPISEIDNNFTVTNDTSFLNGVGYLSQEVFNHLAPPQKYYYTFIHSYWYTYWIALTSRTAIQYDANGHTATTTTNYTFNPTTRNLALAQQSTSDGQTLEEKYKYPEDYVSSLTGNMVSNRVLSPMLEQQVWMKRDANDSTLISGQVTQYDQNMFKPVAAYSIETTKPIATLSNETVSGGKYSTLLSTAQYVLKSQMVYDQNNCPSTVTKASDMSVSYIWDYRHTRAVAKVANAAQSDIGYTSFEADGTGNWTVPAGTITTANAFTGNSFYNFGSQPISISGLHPATIYIVSYWSNTNASYSVGGTTKVTTGKLINGWTYFEHTVTGSSSLTVSGSGGIDELRIYPANAQMTTYTYSPLIGKTTECDAESRVTYYVYDGFGRVAYIKDQDGNIVKTFQYHYKGE